MPDKAKKTIELEQVPERPHAHVTLDIFHVHGTEYVVSADVYSGYFDFVELRSRTTVSVISLLNKRFATHGIPDRLLTDNA